MPSPSNPDLFPAFPLADYLHHQKEIDAALERTLARGHYILGGEVAEFEREFAAFVGTRHAVGAANGTDAIELILRALDVGAGCGVVVPSHTAVASASAVSRAGAQPVFADVEADTCTLCPRSLAALLDSPRGKRVRAVLAVHLYGHPCDMDSLARVCGERGVVLIEDCAQAHGATHKGRNAGALARAAAFSFYPTKNLGAIGDGGAVTTDDDALAARIRSIREYGWVRRYISDSVGVNSRLDELQAAILRVKLRDLPARIGRRRELAGLYAELLAGCGFVTVPEVRDGCGHAYHLYVIQSPRRDALMEHLKSRGVPVALHYPAAIHQQPGYAGAAADSPALPVTDALMPRILTLPLHPYMSDEAVHHVCEQIRDFAG